MTGRSHALLVLAAACLIGGRARAQDLFPFDLQSGRDQPAMNFTVQSAAAPPTDWSRAPYLSVRGTATQSTKDLQVISPLTLETEGGAAAEISADPIGDKALNPGQRIALPLRGRFPAPGIYRGQLRLHKDGREQAFPLQVMVTGPLPVVAHGGKAMAMLDQGVEDNTLLLDLRNTSGETLRGVHVTFAGAARLDKADNPTYQLAASGIGDLPTRPSAESPPNGGPGATLPVDPGDTPGQDLRPGVVRRFSVRLAHLDRAGIYSVETLVHESSGVYRPHELKTLVYRRQPGWLAAIFVALGALGAWVVRYYVSDGDKRLALQRQSALLLSNIQVFWREQSDVEVIAAARALESDVEDRRRYLRRDTFAAVKSAIERAETRLELLRRAAALLEPLKRLDPGQQTEARKALDRALAAVRNDPRDATKLEERLQALEAIDADSLLRDRLRERLEQLNRQIGQQKQLGGSTLQEDLRALDGDLAQAEAALREDRRADLGRLLDQVQGQVLDACVKELGQLAVDPGPPRGVAPPEWQVQARRITGELAGAKADVLGRTLKQRNEAFLNAQRVYFETAVRGLIRHANQRIAQGDPCKDALRQVADTLQKTLDQGVEQAALLYHEQLRRVDAPAPGSVSDGEVGAARGEIAAERGLAPLALPSAEPAQTSALAAAEVTRFDRTITSVGGLVNGLVFLVAVCSGVKALWVDNLAWGGHEAWLIAFLWGSGVQATGDAFADLLSLRAKLGAPPT